MKNVIGMISILVVLSITWMIGYLTVISNEKTSLAFSFLFCILNATQVQYLAILRLIIEILKQKSDLFVLQLDIG